MSKLDDASWHYGGDEFPDGMPEENGATHIGMFVAWAIANDLWGELLGKEAAAAIADVRARRISGRVLLLEHCDGKLLSEMLTPEGAAFADAYYARRYLRDFQRTLARGLSSDYLVEDTWANFDKMAAVIAERFRAWREKPWWRFW